MGTERADAGRLYSMGGAASDGRNGHIVSMAAIAGVRNNAKKIFMAGVDSCDF
jgi:hypothetical protein